MKEILEAIVYARDNSLISPALAATYARLVIEKDSIDKFYLADLEYIYKNPKIY